MVKKSISKKAGMKVKAKEMREKEGNKTLDNIVKSIMLISSIGLVFSLFAKPIVISAQNVQLAPPMPNYMIYALLGLLIISAVYLFVRNNRKKKSRIPLSF